MAALSRRAFLLLTAALASLASRGARAQSRSVSLEEFVRLSERLVRRSPLDRNAAAIYLDALVASHGGTFPALNADLERTLIEWWYTGVCEVKGERRVATHTGALMWDAMGVAPAGSCAGEFGAWSRAPKRIA
jgi:hypothetical protein